MFICSSNGKGEIILNYFLRESLVQVAQINNNWMLDNCNYFNKSVTIDGIRKYEQLSFLRQSHNFSLIFNSKSESEVRQRHINNSNHYVEVSILSPQTNEIV